MVDALPAEARVVRAGGRLVWAEADVLPDGEMVGSSPRPVKAIERAIAGRGERRGDPRGPPPGCLLRRLPYRLERTGHDEPSARRFTGARKRRGVRPMSFTLDLTAE